jgi:putative aldouronate transport system permease protein
MIKESFGSRLFDAVNISLLLMLSFTMFYPFLYCLVLSLSSEAYASQGGFFLYPRSFDLTAYKAVFSKPHLLSGMMNSIMRVLISVPISVLLTALCAYPLSRKETPYRKTLFLFVLFTMLFSGGMVPVYLLYNNIGLLDNRLVYLVQGLIAAFNVILVRNYFQNIPESMHQAAMIDGASEWYIFFRIYLPLSKPILVTIAMFQTIFHWNAWFDAMIYMTSDKKVVLQAFLQRIVIQQEWQQLRDIYVGLPPESIKAATVIITVVPILFIFPFVLRHFSKGIMLGGLKE